MSLNPQSLVAEISSILEQNPLSYLIPIAMSLESALGQVLHFKLQRQFGTLGLHLQRWFNGIYSLVNVSKCKKSRIMVNHHADHLFHRAMFPEPTVQPEAKF